MYGAITCDTGYWHELKVTHQESKYVCSKEVIDRESFTTEQLQQILTNDDYKESELFNEKLEKTLQTFRLLQPLTPEFFLIWWQ